MATITEDYVSFETAKLLKEKGFEGFTMFSYSNRGTTMCGHWENETDWLPKCTLQMATKWLREVHNVAIVISPSMFWGKYNVSIYKKGNDYPFGFDGDSLIPSYEEACEVAIKYCLENFI